MMMMIYDWNHVRKFVMFSDNNLYEITRKCKFDYTDGVHHNVIFEFKILQETNNLRITKRTSKWQVHFHSTTIIPSLTNVYRYLLKNNSYWTSGINWQKNAILLRKHASLSWKISQIIGNIIIKWPYRYWRVNCALLRLLYASGLQLSVF